MSLTAYHKKLCSSPLVIMEGNEICLCDRLMAQVSDLATIAATTNELQIKKEKQIFKANGLAYGCCQIGYLPNLCTSVKGEEKARGIKKHFQICTLLFKSLNFGKWDPSHRRTYNEKKFKSKQLGHMTELELLKIKDT